MTTRITTKRARIGAALLGLVLALPVASAQAQNPAVITGKVSSVSFQSGEPQLTVETRDGRTIAGIALTSVSRIGLEE